MSDALNTQNTLTMTEELKKLRTNIANSYAELEKMGATIPTKKNTDNLAHTIKTAQLGSPTRLTVGMAADGKINLTFHKANVNQINNNIHIS